MGTVSNIPDDELLRRAVNGARGYNTRGWHARWEAVADVFQLGSTYSADLCRRFGFDPDEKVKQP
jgi:hypothetical protein